MDTFEEPPAEAPKKAAKKPAPKKVVAKVAIADDEEGASDAVYPHSVTFKAGSGPDAPWIVLRARTLSELRQMVEGEGAADLAAVMQGVGKAATYFVDQYSGAKPSARGTSNGEAAKPEYQQAPGGEERFCKHGRMEFKSGISKAGNAYKLFSCTAPDRNDQCKAQYLR